MHEYDIVAEALDIFNDVQSHAHDLDEYDVIRVAMHIVEDTEALIEMFGVE